MNNERGISLELENALLAELEDLDNPEAYRSFRDRLRGHGPGTGMGRSRALIWLQGAVSQKDLDFEKLVEDLKDQTRLGRAAAFCLVERLGSNPTTIENLILAPTPYEAPNVNRFGSSHIIDLIGLSGTTELIPLLKRVICENYHYHPPDWTARALEHLGAKAEALWTNRGCSITVSQTGSSLAIQHDKRFTGSSNCPDCRWFPCRINDYYRGAIQDCKLWNRTSPVELLEIVDHRPEEERGPTREPQKTSSSSYCCQAEELILSDKLSEAAEAWQLAARHANDANEQLHWITQAMRTMILAGDRPAAYALATLAEDKSRAAEDRDVIRRWERTHLSLQEELGVYVSSRRKLFRTARGRIQAGFFARFRRGPGQDLDELSSAAKTAEQYLSETATDDWLSYRWQSYLMSAYRTLSRPDLAGNMVRRMLGEEVTTGSPRSIEFGILEARYNLYFDDVRGAVKYFQRLVPEIRACQDPDRRLEYFGYVSEAFSLAPEPSSTDSLSLAREAHALYVQTLGRQFSAPSRKRFRERHQRTIESVVSSLLQHAGGPGSEAENECLAEVWRLVIATRNPELQHARLALSDEEARKLSNLEDSLHRGLHYYRVEGSGRDQFLEKFLRRVVDFEVAHTRRRKEQQEIPKVDGTSPAVHRLQWFAFRELEPEGTYLLLINACEQYRAIWLRNCDEIFEKISAWQQYTDDLTRCGLNDLRCSREVYSARSRRKAVEKPDETAVGRAIGHLLGEPLKAGCEVRVHDLYPEGPIYTLPLEALPDPANPGSYVGERLATRYCLRPRPRRNSDEMISLQKGWLGLGGAPKPKGDTLSFGFLAGSRQEVESLAQDLKRCGTSVAISLTGDEAHLENLVDALKEHRPSVLHLAAHGICDEEYPDACALVLAVEPGGAAGALLPFRSIRDLPVEGVELVVLSACWSLVGPVGSGTGSEGLAWALLDAGVDHVLASRYPVSDHHTVKFMRCFYRHLLDWPPAEALRQTRIEAFRLEGVPLRELGAWALWC